MTQSLPPLSFQHIAPELRLYCGSDSLAALARELKRGGYRRVVIVTGNSVSRSTAMDLLRTELDGVLAGESHAVKSNSPVTAVAAVTGTLREFAADCVIAVGGGSAAVTARAASVALAEGKSLQELCTRRQADGEFVSPRLPATKLPQFVVPTTPSTAFVKAGSAAHDPATGERLAVFDPKTRAKAVFIHPAFLATSPLELTSTASLNTLSTAIEALESPKCDPISEALLMHAVRLTSEHLGNLTPQGTSVRERLAIAGVLCGRGTEQAGGGLASVLAHATGHRVHVANGTINAIVLPHTMRFNAPATVGTLGRIVESLPRSTSNGSEGAVHSLEKLFDRLGIARRLRDIGVAESDLTEIAEAAMADWFITRAPRKVAGVSELRGILEQAW